MNFIRIDGNDAPDGRGFGLHAAIVERFCTPFDHTDSVALVDVPVETMRDIAGMEEFHSV